MRKNVTMDAKDLRSDSTLVSAINDGSTNFDENSITLLSNRNKSYQDIESNSLGKVEAQGSRPCAIIGPDRVQPPPTAGDAYLKKASVEPWPCSDTVYQLQTEIPQKLPDYQMRNISPRQTFQENMQRIMVPPSYHSTKSIEDNVLKSSKADMPLEVKYCDVPYSINPLVNSQKSIRSSDVPISTANSPYLTVQRHGWSGAVGPRPQRPYASDFYQYPEAANFPGQRPLPRVHRPPQEDHVQGHPDRLYNETSVRFKPYPSTRERYPQHRYDYVTNYQNTYHPQLPFPPQKYDISKTLPSHPYTMYPQVPIRRVPDPIIDPYQRPSQPNFNPYQNQYVSHSYGPVQGNCIPSKMYPYPPDMSPNTAKLPYDVNSKLYVDYDNVRNKMYSSVDNMTYFNDPKRQALTMHPGMNMHHIPQHHVYRKDNMLIKPLESPHTNSYALPHHLHFSPSFSKSPADTFTRIDAMHASIGGLQEDCGYVSQSSSASGRSIDSGNFRIQSELYRKNDTFYGNGTRTSQKQRSNSGSTSDKKGLNVRQFLQMWNEGEDEVSDTSISSTALPAQSESNAEQLIILGSMTIPNEELSKYEHIQKISKLPENIKGYNSIELLDQYEQLVETPAIRYNKKPMSHEYQLPPKIAKHSPLIPRPVSPLDVEAKISQSVIHKEVGCNFEIKPCSPKMMSVEIATPLHNIISERTIEKVLNTGITNSQVLPTRADIVAVNSPTTSCKMNTTYNTNEDLIKNNNYSLQDLESNSGVCLASLPRLDSDLELNFPEINQQFIDANRFKISTTDEDVKSSTAQSLFKSENDCDKDVNDRRVQTPELHTIETAKLSKYRKIKAIDSLPNESRTDSVIIKNPDTVRKKEVCNITGLLQEKFENIQEVVMKSDIEDNTILKDMSCIAIDFSLNTLKQNSEVNTDSENILIHTDIQTDNISTKDENETQMCALSLVTKKVEMELRELEQNDYKIKKQNEPGFSLGLIYEDTTILPELDPKIDHTTRINTTTLSDIKNLSDVEKLIPCSSHTDLEGEIQFECDKANHKDEDIFKDEIVIAALGGSSIKHDNLTDSNKYNMNEEKEIFSVQDSNISCNIETNDTPEQKISNDLMGDSNIFEESVLIERQNRETQLECNNSIIKKRHLIDNTFNHMGSPDCLEEITTHSPSTENLSQSKENSVKETFKYENVNEPRSPRNTLQLDNQNADSVYCEYNNKNDVCKQGALSKNEMTSELSIQEKNIERAQICNKLYIKEDININNENDSIKRKNEEAYDLVNSSTDTIPQSGCGNIGEVNQTFPSSTDAEKDDLEEKGIMQENLTTDLQLPSESLISNIRKETFSSTQDSSEISIETMQTDDGDSSVNYNNDNSLSSCNEGHIDMAPKKMEMNKNELKCDISSGFNKDSLNGDVSEDEDKHHNNDNSLSLCNEGLIEIAPEKMEINKNQLKCDISSGFNKDSLNNEVSADEVKHHNNDNSLPLCNEGLFDIVPEKIEINKNEPKKDISSGFNKDSLNSEESEDEVKHHKNDNSLSSCNEGLINMAPEKMKINKNELKSNISAGFKKVSLNSEVSEDEVKHHSQYHTFNIYKKFFYKGCFTKECFSPWMQKLFLFSSGRVKSSQDQTEDTKDATYSTNIDYRPINEKKMDGKCVDKIEGNINDMIFTSTPNALSKEYSNNKIDKSCNESRILIDKCRDNVGLDCIQEENIESVDSGNIESNNGDNDLIKTPIEKLKNNLIFPKSVGLKRSLSDSAIDVYSDDSFNRVSSNKRRRLIFENFIESNKQDVCDVIQSNRRKSISAICNTENLLIFIDDNEYIIADEDGVSRNVEYVEESSEFLQLTENSYDVYEVHKELQNDSILATNELNVDCPVPLNDLNQEKWLGTDSCIENIFNDDVAVDITISAPISPENSNLSSNDSVCTDNENDHIVRIKEIYGENMCINDMEIVETLYKMPQMNVNKTLVDIESLNSLENKNDVLISQKRYMEMPHQNNNPIPLDVSCKNDDDIILENEENRDIESPVNVNYDNDDVYKYVRGEKNKESCELINNCMSLASNDCKYSASSSPEVSSTTSEDKCSAILLKITSVNGSRRSEINNVPDNVQHYQYKLTEKNNYNTNYRPLITKAAQKYIPPIIDSHDLKVKLPLPPNSLNKFKQLKLANSEALYSTITKHKKANMRQDVRKKVKPKFEDVLKSIDEIQFKMHKDKFKKTKHSIPKVLIKKHENGAHYASTSIKKQLFNPDLTGRKWQPWVFIERNDFVDRMAQRNKRKAVYCHRKKTFVLEEKFKKYKSICTAKFVISQPTSDHPSSGNLKYTIRLKHNY